MSSAAARARYRRGSDARKIGGTVEHHLLGDQAAERESEDIARIHAESVEERDDMLRHAGDGLSAQCQTSGPTPAFVEQNELPLGGGGRLSTRDPSYRAFP